MNLKKQAIAFVSAASVALLAGAAVGQDQQRDPQPRASEIRAYSGGNGTSGMPAGELATSFEEFSLGDINGQEGWFGTFGTWVIADARPALGSQHVESVSDGLGQTLMFSPNVGIGTNSVNSVGFNLQISSGGATWRMAPQSPGAGFVNTEILIADDRTVNALVDDGSGSAVFAPVGFTMPINQYVEFFIEVDRTTFDFELFINGTRAFTGTGFAGDIEELVAVGGMEAGTTGDTLDIDDVAIIDGPAPVQPPASAVPANNAWALALLVALLAGLGVVAVRRFA